MRNTEHPTPDLLLRFLYGEASRTEQHAIVRTQAPAETDPSLVGMDLPTELRAVARNVAEGYLLAAIDALRGLLPKGEG